MCYSKEVQLITAILIFVSIALYYFIYHKKYSHLREKWECKFLKYLLIGGLLIGGHQLFEFLSLITHNAIIYKTGLILSISAIYFGIKSFEVLVNKKVHSWIVLIIIIFVAISVFMTEANFSANSFYVQHNTGFIWAASWFFIFIYFHAIAIREYMICKKDKEKHEIILFLLATFDISFLISLIYTLFSYSRFGINVCTDAPSIWCTFFVVQALFIPFLLFKLNKAFNRPKRKRTQPSNITIKLLIISVIILALLIATLPFFDCLSWKYVFP
jgi:hypothetical protein